MHVAFVHQAFEYLGVEQLIANLKKNNIKVSLLFEPAVFNDRYLTNYKIAHLFNYQKIIINRLKDLRPSLIAFSVVSPNFSWALQIAGEIKKQLDIPILFGGIHPSAAPDTVMQFNEIDYVLIGESDYSLIELCKQLDSSTKNFYKVPGLYYRENGIVSKVPTGHIVDNLDELPFFDKELFYKEAPYLKFGYTTASSRGCPESCAFCYNSFFSKLHKSGKRYYRRRSVNHLIEELSKAKVLYSPKVIRFYDETFTEDVSWLEEFSYKYKKKINLPFWCLGIPFSINKDTISLLENAGCYELQLGVQTVRQKTRETLLGRADSLQDVKQAILLLQKSSILLSADTILHAPGQSIEEMEEMALFYNQNRPDRLNLYWMTYFPGAKIVNTAVDMGLITEKDKDKLNLFPKTYTIQTNDTDVDNDIKKIHNLLSILLFLPKNIAKLLINKKFYKLIPRVNPLLMSIIVHRFRNVEKYSIFKNRFKKRYLNTLKTVLSTRKPKNVRFL